MKKIIAILLALTMVLGMCACGGEKVDEALLGTYTCYSAETEGIELPADMIFTEPCTVVLNDNGKADFNLDGDEFTVSYTIDGNAIEMKDGSDTITGTIGDGKMEIDLMGVILYMAKDGAAPSGDAATEEAATEEPAAEEAASGAAFEPITAQLGDYEVTIVGAEHFDDIDGEPGIRFYYDFTNNSDELVCPFMELDWAVTQEGYDLTETYDDLEDDVAEYGNDTQYIVPGLTIRCISEYSYKPDGGEIAYTVSNWYTEESVTAKFTPDNLTGRPAELEMPAVTDCTLTADMSSSADFDEGKFTYTIGEYEVVEGYGGTTIVRIYVDFTNNSDEEETFWGNSRYYAIQDGVSLESGYASEEVDTDNTESEYVQPGQTITCSLCYELRSESPVELVMYDLWDTSSLGLVIPVA